MAWIVSEYAKHTNNLFTGTKKLFASTFAMLSAADNAFAWDDAQRSFSNSSEFLTNQVINSLAYFSFALWGYLKQVKNIKCFIK